MPEQKEMTLEVLKRALSPKNSSIEDEKEEKAEIKIFTLEEEIEAIKKDMKEEIPKNTTPIFNFGEALFKLKNGERVRRIGWNGKGMWLVLAYQLFGDKKDNEICFNKSYSGVGNHLSNFIVMKTADNKLVPWLASQTDILVEDWEIE